MQPSDQNDGLELQSRQSVEQPEDQADHRVADLGLGGLVGAQPDDGQHSEQAEADADVEGAR